MPSTMSRNDFLRTLATGTAAAALPALGFAAPPSNRRVNVLFFAVDDLRTQIGCYGHPQMITPNLDRLAAEGMIFTRAYCQQAVCNPSRASLMTGTRPDTTKVWDLNTHFRVALPDVVTLSQHFKNNGYYVHGMGKIYHGGFDDKPSWSVPSESPPLPPEARGKARGGYYSETGKGALEEQTARQRKAREEYMTKKGKTTLNFAEKRRFRPRGLPWDNPDVPDNWLSDGALADRAVEVLRQRKSADQPFFLAVGFHKPHLPFISPKKYWDLYTPDRIKLADNPYPPKGAPPYAVRGVGELGSYYGVKADGNGLLPDAVARQAVHGYYAAVSYTDAQVGRVVDELDRLGLRDNTVIVLWGDHGWKLGEHASWAKHTNVENDTNAPLFFSAPGIKGAGAACDALAEFVDIYPTLCDLCGLPKPAHLEGTSLAPLLDDPARPWKKAAFSQYPRAYGGKSLMGYSMRTDRYRYTEWRDLKTGDNVAVELYDHQSDPQENINVATRPENARVVRQLGQQCRAGWQAARLETSGG